MAYDGFQRSSSPYDQAGNIGQTKSSDYRSSTYPPPYPSQYGPDRLNMPQPQVPPAAPSPTQGQYAESPQQYSWYQQPSTGTINEAVSSAFHKAETPTYLSPEVLSQITATVIQQLKATGLDNFQAQHAPQSPQPSPQPPSGPTPSQWVPPPPSSAPQYSYNEYESPPPVPPKPSSPQPVAVSDTPDYQQYSQTSPYPSSVEPSARPSPVPPVERRGSPYSQASDQGQKMEARPKPPSRETTVTEMTTLEKIWGKLFEEGRPTKRLGQLLRGIAVHLIEDYPPGNTFVVVPEKLQKYYEDTKVPSDLYPWQDIFDDRTSSISRLFREVEAEHHLVQAKLNERPDIPGLTPRGFERWATLMIQAHPDKEYERLQKAVLNMPISNPDDRRERFPKEIPRRLFPEAPNLKVRDELDKFIVKHCGVDLPPVTEEELKKVAAHRHKMSTSSTVSAAETASSVPERGRQQQQHQSSSAIIDDDEEEVPSRPIERERKPYSAQPGGGKVYEEAGGPSHRHKDSFSTGSRSKEGSVPPVARKAYGSYGQDPLYPRAGSCGSQRPISTHGRARSSSRGGHGGGDYRHSESDLLSGSYNGGGRYSGVSSDDYYTTSSALPGDIIEDGRRYRESDDPRPYESVREREKEREKSKYHDHFPSRSSWSNEEEYYRGLLGGQGGGPVTGSGGGYDYRTYTYK
ncbi:hypothetical protein KXV65_001557 [Aspergillus fumigatus]|nr:hypothetical protein KXX47_007076 [Aspergillus fumigatus]KAH1422283.1 hypothetical protein KXX32_007737 [Aspergillus fumigatus]KAH1452661.1 hypothetical protein KXX58_002982 [Aspergillus fumigatus]KAH1840264.1 hypothetical protein KXX54_002631 [Aspergillus fumigatus]KAH2032143.1 hypothetical protein KXV65_001557 [Aspergillus fumigatus]